MKRARPYDRDSALNAAMNLFWRKGYHATSLKDLEFALNMKPGSIYAAFHSKEALFLASLERYMQVNQVRLGELLAGTGSPLAALAEFLRSFVYPANEARGPQVCMIVKSMLEATDADKAIAEAARTYLDNMTGEIIALFRAAQDSGELPGDADAVLLGRRYLLNLTALRIEAQWTRCGAELKQLAESMAQEVEALAIRSSEN